MRPDQLTVKLPLLLVLVLVPSFGGSLGADDQANRSGSEAASAALGGPSPVVKGNFDNVQGPDLVFRNINTSSADFNRHKVWFMDGVTRTAEAFITPNPQGPNWLAVGSDDFDNALMPGQGPDGRTDLVFYNTTTGQVEFWLLNGVNRIGPPVPLSGGPPLPLNWSLSATGDFNADGRPDLVWRNFTSQKIVIWLMSGTNRIGSIIPVPDQAVDGNWEIVAALDYNNDTARDFLWYNSTSGRIVTWYMNPMVQRISGQFVTPPAAGDSNWKVRAGGDYSWDYTPGTPPLDSADIVWRNETSAAQVVWHLDFNSTRVFGQFTQPVSNPFEGAGDAPLAPLDWMIVGPR